MSSGEAAENVRSVTGIFGPRAIPVNHPATSGSVKMHIRDSRWRPPCTSGTRGPPPVHEDGRLATDCMVVAEDPAQLIHASRMDASLGARRMLRATIAYFLEAGPTAGRRTSMDPRPLTFRFATLALAWLASAPAHASLLVVLNKQDNALVTIDPVALKVVGRVATGNGPHEVATSADGKLAFVTNYGDQQPNNSLSVIDLAAMKELRRIDLGAFARPHGIEVRNGKAFVTSEVTRSVVRFDPATDRIDWINGTGQTVTHMLAVTADGRRLFTANIGSNTVTAIHIGTGPEFPAQIRQISVGAQPEAIAITPDDREVWAGHNGDGHISIIDTTTNTVKQTIKAGEMPIRIKFTPDGKRALVSDPRGGELIVFDVASRKADKRLKIEGLPLGIQMQPDGKRAYVALAQANKVAVLDLATVEIVAQIETGRAPDGLAWSVLTP
jgi:YVTN family beta-propeller protein